MIDVKFSNGFELTINNMSWECGDGCCLDSWYDYFLWDPANKITVVEVTESRMDYDEIIEDIVNDYELEIVWRIDQ